MKNYIKHLINLAILFIISLITGISVLASVPPLRTQVSLNGKWDFEFGDNQKATISVPALWDQDSRFGSDIKEANYIKKLTIPKSWLVDNKRVKIEFDGVLQTADVYIDDKLVTSHVGGWIPFSSDITDFVKPGIPFTLKVHIKGGALPPIVDKKGYPLWPVGLYGHERKWGIVFDVWLRNYGAVLIQDAFIQTSYRNNSITVDYEIKNSQKQPQSIIVKGIISPEGKSEEILALESDVISLQPGETKKVILTKAWNNPRLWNTEDPFLYLLKSTISLQGRSEEIDAEQRRFGFREIWIEGNQYKLNGHRMNFRGDNVDHHNWGREIIENQQPEAYGEIIDRWKKLNYNIIRYHREPPPPYVLDMADEKGMFLMPESALFSRGYIQYVNMPQYLENSRKWIGEWVKGSRNHPSVIMWAALNEYGRNYIRSMTDTEMRNLGDVIHALDPTRPVVYDGEMDIGAETVNLHYPMIFLNHERGDIYQWAKYVHPSKPTGIGEYLYMHRQKSFIPAVWNRGMRYDNFADIRPFLHNWTWNEDWSRTREPGAGQRIVLGHLFDNNWEEWLENDLVYILIRNSFAPIALFDKEYDRLGGEIYEKQQWPNLYEGSIVERTLVLYNDDYAGTEIEIKVSIVFNDEIIATGSKVISLPLGEHADIPVTFQVPVIGSSSLIELYNPSGTTFEMVLETSKNGVKRFEEHKQFYIWPTGYSGLYDSGIKAREPVKSDY
jgi:hypothetical protein